MRHTPRHASRPRGIGTLIGNGWLRESPRNYLPREWDRLGRSALKKCMFLPAAPQLYEAAGIPLVPPLPAPRPKAEPPLVAHHRNPKRDVRQLPAVDPADVARASRLGRSSWWEDPVALGTLLVVIPPIGLAAVWSSRRYSGEARWALTMMTALTMCLVAAVTIVLILR
jgi:hypothetical protein